MIEQILDARVVPEIYRHALGHCVKGGLYLEFGVAQGTSLRVIRQILRPDIPLYGFDSFKGLPEPWCHMPAGSFATSMRPKLPNTKLIIGRFEDTLPQFVSEHREPVSFVHIDCDVYSSTITVLRNLKFVNGSVILFDELFGYDGYEQYEYRALKEWVEETGIKFNVISRWTRYRAAIQVTAWNAK